MEKGNSDFVPEKCDSNVSYFLNVHTNQALINYNYIHFVFPIFVLRDSDGSTGASQWTDEPGGQEHHSQHGDAGTETVVATGGGEIYRLVTAAVPYNTEGNKKNNIIKYMYLYIMNFRSENHAFAFFTIMKKWYIQCNIMSFSVQCCLLNKQIIITQR